MQSVVSSSMVMIIVFGIFCVFLVCVLCGVLQKVILYIFMKYIIVSLLVIVSIIIVIGFVSCSVMVFI